MTTGYDQLITRFIDILLKKEKENERREIGTELIKGVWWMPRLLEAKKDVISCEKLRGLANTN